MAVAKALLRGLVAGLALILALPAMAETTSPITIGQLLADGWEVAGYSAAFTTTLGALILFKHKDRNYFVQCSAGYDATRSQRTAERVVSNCYELH